MLVTIVCVLFGALLAVIVAGLGGALWVAMGIGVAGVLILFVVSTMLGARAAEAAVTEPDAMFPTPPHAEAKA